MITTIIPWRPPGDRMPSGPETAICRPFIERQIALTEPRQVLVLGNFAARFFFGETGTIHALRESGARSAPAAAVCPPWPPFIRRNC